jgi:CheY-like chemotaxis protein
MAKILIVEDEATMRQVIAAALRRAGYVVAEASNGLEALGEIRRGGVDLVITDILMPERDGIEMLMTLRSDGVNVPVIAITGIPLDAGLYLDVAHNLGARRTLEKPFKIEALLQAANEVLAEAK